MRRASLLLAIVLAGTTAVTGCSATQTGAADPRMHDQPSGPPTPTSTPTPTNSAQQEQLASARERWEASGPADYDWSYEVSCFCPGVAFDLRVQDGAAAGFTALPSGSGALPQGDVSSAKPAMRTVEDLFESVEANLDDGADRVDVEYDDRTGRPLSITVDPDVDAFDDEFTVSVTRFVVR